MTARVRRPIVALTFVVGLMAGYGSAALALKCDVLLDYDTGRLKERAVLWPFVLWETPVQPAGLLLCASGTPSSCSAGKEDWQRIVTHRGRGLLDHSTGCTDAAFVLNEARRLENHLPRFMSIDIASLRDGILCALATNGVAGVAAYVERTEGQWGASGEGHGPDLR
jgi:hypothetical protein